MADRKAVLFDIDGVLTISWRALPGAAEAVNRVRDAGMRVAFLTNTTSVSARTIAERLNRAGIALEPSEVFTAARAAARYVEARHPGSRCLLLNSGSPDEDLTGIDVVPADSGEPVEVVLTGGAGPEVTYEALNSAFRALLGGAAMVAMHRNWFWATADGPQLDMGAFVSGLEQAANVSAMLVGKPAPEFFHSVLDQVAVAGDEAVMVGDDIFSDVLGGQGIGMKGVLVRTGKFRPDDVERAEGQPDEIIDSVAELPALLGLGN